MMAPGLGELMMLVFGLLFGVAPLIVMILVIVAVFRRLDRIVAATEATAQAVQRLEQQASMRDGT